MATNNLKVGSSDPLLTSNNNLNFGSPDSFLTSNNNLFPMLQDGDLGKLWAAAQESGLNWNLSPLSADSKDLGILDFMSGQREIGADPSFFGKAGDWFWGGKNKDGTSQASGALGLANLAKSGLEIYTGLGELDVAKDALAETKRQFDLNFGAQQATTNDALAWQHNARTNRNANYDGELVQI